MYGQLEVDHDVVSLQAGADPAAAARTGAPPVAITPPATPSAAGLSAACDKLEKGPLASLSKAAAALAPEFQPSSDNFCAGMRAMLGIVRLSQQRGRPSQAEWPQVAKALAECVINAGELAGGPRSKATNHHKALEESLQGLLWVTFDCSAPGAHLTQLVH